MRLKAAAGRLKIVSEDGIGALLPLAPTLEKLVSRVRVPKIAAILMTYLMAHMYCLFPENVTCHLSYVMRRSRM